MTGEQCDCGHRLQQGEWTYECRCCFGDTCPRCIDAEGRFCRNCYATYIGDHAVTPFVSANDVDHIEETFQ